MEKVSENVLKLVINAYLFHRQLRKQSGIFYSVYEYLCIWLPNKIHEQKSGYHSNLMSSKFLQILYQPGTLWLFSRVTKTLFAFTPEGIKSSNQTRACQKIISSVVSNLHQSVGHGFEPKKYVEIALVWKLVIHIPIRCSYRIIIY